MPTAIENQFYPSRSGKVITVDFMDRTPATRGAGALDVIDYNFYVTMSQGARQRVSVAVLPEALTALEQWITDNDNVDRLGAGGSAHDVAVDLCIARILEAIDQGIDLDQDFSAYPNSFLKISGAPGPISKIATEEIDDAVRNYVSRRLYAARRACRKTRHECGQYFERPDWFYLKVGRADFERVITEHEGDRWELEYEDELYLTWTDALIQELREEDRLISQRTRPPLVIGQSPIQGVLPASSEQKKGRLRRVIRWLEHQRQEYGVVWAIVTFIVFVVLAVLAL